MNILSNMNVQSRATLENQVGQDGVNLKNLQRSTDAIAHDKEITLDEKHTELRKAAQQYEALFFQQLMDAMDKTIDRSDSMFSGGNTEKMFRDMLNQEMATSATSSPGKKQGLGIADAIYQQMSMVLDGKVTPPSSGNVDKKSEEAKATDTNSDSNTPQQEAIQIIGESTSTPIEDGEKIAANTTKKSAPLPYLYQAESNFIGPQMNLKNN
jgi:Rod binding domain-containing protein